jgi:peptidoglycan/LPS O-acetylase OafA/YrhL
MLAHATSFHTTRPALLQLTGLRFIAALLVVLFHVQRERPAGIPAWLWNIVANGYVGVSLFFVLSGFILAYTYLHHDDDHIPLRAFWTARFARVYPVYLLGLLVSAQFFFEGVEKDSQNARMFIDFSFKYGLPPLALLQSWSPSWVSQWNSPGWSLSVEAFFYACFPFLGRFLLPRSQRTLATIIGVMWLCAIIPVLWYMHTHTGNANITTSNDAIRAIKFNPVYHLPEFILGIAAGRIFVRVDRARLWAWSGWMLWISGSIILITLMLMRGQDYLFVHNGVLAPVFAMFIAALAAGRSWLAALLSTRQAVLLGEASYALYILHVPLLIWWRRGIDSYQAQIPAGIATTMYVAIAIFVSILVFRYFEQPVRKRVRRALASST